MGSHQNRTRVPLRPRACPTRRKRLTRAPQDRVVVLPRIADLIGDGVILEALFEAAHYGLQLGVGVIPEPLFEVTTKFEEFDRAITFQEAIDSLGLMKEELEAAREMTLKMDTLMSKEVEKRGLLHVDGKKEYALGAEGQLMLIDTFGTPDEDRFWDVKAYEQGKFIELSKEYVRQYYRGTRYHEALMDAREAGQIEPDIPELPPQMVDDTADLYANLFTRITGQEF